MGASQPTINIFGLLYVGEESARPANYSASYAGDPLEDYIGNAVLLAASLYAQDCQLTILTNQPDRLADLVKLFPATAGLHVVEIPFPLEVPPTLAFREAHHKLDAWRYLGSRSDLEYVGMLDIDMVCLRAPVGLYRAASLGIPLTYDITDQIVPGYGFDEMAASIDAVAGRATTGKWFGGEFLFGPPHFFSLLSREADICYLRYLPVADTVVHQGDEMILAAAIDSLVVGGMVIDDAGSSGIVSRIWSVAPRHRQRGFRAMMKSEFVHLPADKDFLANLARADNHAEDGTLRREIVLRLFKRLPRRLVGRARAWHWRRA